MVALRAIQSTRNANRHDQQPKGDGSGMSPFPLLTRMRRHLYNSLGRQAVINDVLDGSDSYTDASHGAVPQRS